MSIPDLRSDYGRAELNEQSAAHDAIEQFSRWFDEARAAGVREVNAMGLATASTDGRPCTRIVLLKEGDASGCGFSTNYHSRTGRELQDNPLTRARSTRDTWARSDR